MPPPGFIVYKRYSGRGRKQSIYFENTYICICVDLGQCKQFIYIVFTSGTLPPPYRILLPNILPFWNPTDKAPFFWVSVLGTFFY